MKVLKTDQRKKVEREVNSWRIMGVQKSSTWDHKRGCCIAKVRSVYLITYSQADLDKFQRRDSFARTVVEAFDETRSGLADIVQWVCSQERHSSGGTHYHMVASKKLSR